MNRRRVGVYKRSRKKGRPGIGYNRRWREGSIIHGRMLEGGGGGGAVTTYSKPC